jgi:hypothetical protein
MQALEQLKTYWGKHEGEPGWGRLGRSGDGALISATTEVSGWLATLGRLILLVLQFLPLVSIPEAHQEVSLIS